MKKIDYTVTVKDAKLIFKNFSGLASQYNNEGNRNFCVVLDEDVASDLAEDGWNVKFPVNKTEDPDFQPQPFIQVKVKFGAIPPNVNIIKSNGIVRLDESAVEMLDFAHLTKVDLIFRPYNYEVRGTTGVTAYLSSMYATIYEDELEQLYEGERTPASAVQCIGPNCPVVD